jgi:hypothetical protein
MTVTLHLRLRALQFYPNHGGSRVTGIPTVEAGNEISVIHNTPGTYMLLLILPNRSDVEIG